jgi:hypothetical protein
MMWSKTDAKQIPAGGSTSQAESESVTEMLMDAIRESGYAKEQIPEKHEPKIAGEERHSCEPMFVQYAEAVDKCTKSVTEFIRCASLLSEATQTYEKLKAASDQIRRTLDSDEQQVRTLMDLAHEKAKILLAGGEPVSARKPPEASRPEPFIVNKMTKFP